jgi:nickel transport protein
MRAVAILLLLWIGSASAHEVHHVIAATNAATVSLSYADGSAFAYEKYELYADGKDVPMQVGNTDASGRVVFVPGDTKNWRLKAYSADGHGVDLRFESLAIQASAVAADAGPGRATLALFGLGLILAAFGLYQLLIARRKTP